MELGLTIPLQRRLGLGMLPYGVSPDRRYCWDLHVIPLGGRPSLLAVHCESRYTFVLYDLAPSVWADLPALFQEGLRGSLVAAGISSEKVEGYLRRAGQAGYTRTHGRREVAFLNRAWEDVTALDYTLDTAARSQPMLDRAVNRRLVRCAGFDGLGRAEERFLCCLERREGQ